MYRTDLGDKIIVNYHYVRDSEKTEFPTIKACPIKEFEAQIDFLSRHYSFVSIADLWRSTREGAPGKQCAVTFDDGYTDHIKNVLPILKKYEAPATFFIVTKSLAGKIPASFKLHLISSRLPTADLVKKLSLFMKGAYPELEDLADIPTDHRINPRRRFDDVVTSNFKETLIALDPPIREAFLDSCFRALFKDEKKLCAKIFLSESHLRELQNAGMEIANHTHSHYSLEMLPVSVQRTEIQTAQNILARVLGRPPRIFSYPHYRYTDETLELLKELDIDLAVTLQSRPVLSNDHRYMLPRYDTNDLIS